MGVVGFEPHFRRQRRRSPGLSYAPINGDLHRHTVEIPPHAKSPITRATTVLASSTVICLIGHLSEKRVVGLVFSRYGAAFRLLM